MSDIQEMLSNLADALQSKQITEDMCIAVRDALNGVPEEYHLAAFWHFIKGGADRA